MKQMVDTSVFNFRMKMIQLQIIKTMPPKIQEGAQLIHNEVDKNLSGGSYSPGQLPIRRITGTLARALQMAPVNPFHWKVWIDSHIAPYWVYVHFGTSKLARRMFFLDAVTATKAQVTKLLSTGVQNCLARSNKWSKK